MASRVCVLGRSFALVVALTCSAQAEDSPSPFTPSLASPDGSPIIAIFPPRLAAVARPLPHIATPPPGEQVPELDKLRFMAELAERVDARWHLSESPTWRAIMGWPEANESMALMPPGDALDKGLLRYPVPQGKADPSADFRASLALAWLDEARFSCQFPLRARFLAQQSLTPGPLPLERGRCRAFEGWAHPDEVADIELIYVAQRWQDVTASMGHIVFRIRKRRIDGGNDGSRVVGPSSETAFAYIAKDPADTPNYMFRGLTGGLTAGVELERFGDLWARYGVREGRDLHVYRLVLSDEERRFLLAEVFAQSRYDMKVPYAFLTVNCATMAYDTLRSLLPELPHRSDLLVHPHEVVSLLLEHGRAVPRGTIPARKTEAREAERRREALGDSLARTLTTLPQLARAHAARWSRPASRAATLRELVHALEGDLLRSAEPTASSASREAIDTLAAWADAVLDVEAFAVDQATHGYSPGASSPALEAALDLRSLLPASPRYETGLHEPLDLQPLPAGPTRPSGSRRATVQVHALSPLSSTDPTTTRLGLGWQTSVLDEDIGEPRLVTLARGSRMRLLVNELVVSSDGAGLTVERDRLVLVDSLTLGDGVRTDTGWVGARLGFGFGLELMSMPRIGLPFMVHLYGGPTLTLATSRDFSNHLALQLDLDAATWTRVAHGDALFRVTSGLVLEAGLALGDAHRLRLRGRLAPGLDLGGGVLELSASLRLELALVPESGIFLVISGSYRHGAPVAPPLDATIGIAF